MNVSTNIINYYKLLSIKDDTKHPMCYISTKPIFNDYEMNLYFNKKNGMLVMKEDKIGACSEKTQIIIY
jgi:hypothetical protein